MAAALNASRTLTGIPYEAIPPNGSSRAGARGYVTKTIDPGELAAAIV